MSRSRPRAANWCIAKAHRTAHLNHGRRSRGVRRADLPARGVNDEGSFTTNFSHLETLGAHTLPKHGGCDGSHSHIRRCRDRKRRAWSNRRCDGRSERSQDLALTPRASHDALLHRPSQIMGHPARIIIYTSAEGEMATLGVPRSVFPLGNRKKRSLTACFDQLGNLPCGSIGGIASCV